MALAWLRSQMRLVSQPTSRQNAVTASLQQKVGTVPEGLILQVLTIRSL
jgi:hypothetical protein